ncbi:HAD family hydrolase [Thermoproteus tenax]|uniref:HAD superfamily hydrolase n=1 Tax=Thermoproteus tenax (strain ATCC 35583 / DSM 2078 / JCM 9277 / NBRC 100435 / Kra 1) TaxID=768679 RepID=G4RNP4_THETK|nr:HAD family hydrolase [Thermoproteus tenax]CCC81188.1 HAD superfamily hydrolase [Thermoproteus tenax Kra 1]
MIKAVFFDLDGTLIDDVEARKRAQFAVAKFMTERYGVRLHKAAELIAKIEEEMDMARRYRREDRWRALFERLGFIYDGEIGGLLTKIYFAELMEAMRPFKDARVLLSYLRGRVRLGIITDTDGEPGLKRERIKRSGLPLDLFDIVVVAGEDTADTKPSASPFSFAMAKLGLGPWQAVYVGDKAYADVPGAREAGMYTVIVHRGAHSEPKSPEQRPDLMLGSLAQLQFVLRWPERALR